MTMETHIVYLALGSNLGDRLENLRQAIAALSPQMEVKAKSHVYETPPWGYEDQPKFYNQAIKADTYLQPEPLLKHLKRLEVALGRQPSWIPGIHMACIPDYCVSAMLASSPSRRIFR